MTWLMNISATFLVLIAITGVIGALALAIWGIVWLFSVGLWILGIAGILILISVFFGSIVTMMGD